MSRLGRKGGDGATAGRKATTFIVDLPDGTQAKKRDFNPPDGEATGYAFFNQGAWIVAAIAELDSELFSHYTQCPAKREESASERSARLLAELEEAEKQDRQRGVPERYDLMEHLRLGPHAPRRRRMSGRRA